MDIITRPYQKAILLGVIETIYQIGGLTYSEYLDWILEIKSGGLYGKLKSEKNRN